MKNDTITISTSINGNGPAPEIWLETQIAYIHGRIEAEIEAFANALNVPKGFLATRLAALLENPSGGEVLWPVNNLPNVPRQTTSRSATVAKVAMVKRTSGNKTHGHALTSAGRAKLSAGLKKQWAEARRSGINFSTGKKFKATKATKAKKKAA